METIIIKKRDDDIINFLQMPDGVFKNAEYYRTFRYRVSEESDILKTDEGKIHYAISNYSIKKGKKYYMKLKSKKGFTLDEKGKLKIWYGSGVAPEMASDEVLRALKIDWLANEPICLRSYITKGIFEKILNGKISNPIDMLKAYLRAARVKASPKLLYNVCKSQSLRKETFLRYAYCAKNVDHFLKTFSDKDMLSEKGSIINDMLSQAYILEKQIDYKWSLKRLKEEHTKWTKEIMEAEVNSVPDTPVSLNTYKAVEKYIPDWFTPLDSRKKVFIEGSTMSHCVYTNYWPRIDKGFYQAYHINYNGEQATLGLRVENKSISVDQLYGVRNSSVSKALDNKIWEVVNALKDTIKDKNVFDTFKDPHPVEEVHLLPF